MAVSIELSAVQNYRTVSTNSSNITVKLKCSWTYSSYNHNTPSGTVTIDGVTYSFSADINPNKTVSGSNYIFSKTLNVVHDAAGNKTLNCSATFATGISSGTVTDSLTKQLVSIPSLSPEITSVTNFNDEGNPVVTYDLSNASGLSNLEVCISSDGSLDDIAAYRAINRNNKTYTFTLTDTERKALRKSVTKGTSGTVRFYIRGYSSSNTVYSSYVSKTFNLINCYPTISPVFTDTNSVTVALTGDSSKIVRYHSNVSIKANPAGQKEATVTNTTISHGSNVIAGSVGTFNSIQSNQFNFTVKDTRGNTTKKTVYATPYLEYSKPTCNLIANAPTTDGDMTFFVDGNFWNYSFGAVNNSLTVQYRYKENDGEYNNWADLSYTGVDATYTATGAVSGLNYLSTYTFQARVIDSLNTVLSAEKVVNTVPVFDWSKEDFNFNVNVFFPNKNIKDANIGIRSTNSKGTSISALVPCTAEDVLMLGWGNYNAGIGRTNIYGKDINLFTTDSEGNINANGVLSINGREYGTNKLLWSGNHYMTSSQTANLNSSVSDQPHGIIIVFSRISDGVSEDANFNSFFIPKEVVNQQSGMGHCFQMATVNFSIVAAKYLYISDMQIRGNDLNTSTGTGTSGIKYENNAYCMRYVIGV